MARTTTVLDEKEKKQEKQRVTLSFAFMAEEISALLKETTVIKAKKARMAEAMADAPPPTDKPPLARVPSIVTSMRNEAAIEPSDPAEGSIMIISRGDISSQLFEQNLRCYGLKNYSDSASTQEVAREGKEFKATTPCQQMMKHLHDDLTTSGIAEWLTMTAKAKMADTTTTFEAGGIKKPMISAAQIGKGPVKHVFIQFPEMGLQSDASPLFAASIVKSLHAAQITTDKEVKMLSYGAGGSIHRDKRPGVTTKADATVTVRVFKDPRPRLQQLEDELKKADLSKLSAEAKQQVTKYLQYIEGIRGKRGGKFSNEFKSGDASYNPLETQQQMIEITQFLTQNGMKDPGVFRNPFEKEAYYSELSFSTPEGRTVLYRSPSVVNAPPKGDAADNLIQAQEMATQVYLKLCGEEKPYLSAPYLSRLETIDPTYRMLSGAKVNLIPSMIQTLDMMRNNLLTQVKDFKVPDIKEIKVDDFDKPPLSPKKLNDVFTKLKTEIEKTDFSKLTLDEKKALEKKVTAAIKTLGDEDISALVKKINQEKSNSDLLKKDVLHLTLLMDGLTTFHQTIEEIIHRKYHQAHIATLDLESSRRGTWCNSEGQMERITSTQFLKMTETSPSKLRTQSDISISDPDRTELKKERISRTSVSSEDIQLVSPKAPLQIQSDYRETAEFKQIKQQLIALIKSPTVTGVNLTGSMFLGDQMKKGLNTLLQDEHPDVLKKLSDCNMEDDIFINLINVMKSRKEVFGFDPVAFLVERVNVDPYYIMPAVEHDIQQWAQTARYSVNTYVDAIMWGIEGYGIDNFPVSGNWNPVSSDHKNDFETLCVRTGNNQIIDPFFREIGTDFLSDLKKGAAYLTDIRADAKNQFDKVHAEHKILLDRIIKMGTPSSDEQRANLRELVTRLVTQFLEYNHLKERDSDVCQIWVRSRSWGGNVNQSLDKINLEHSNLDRSLYVSGNFSGLKMHAAASLRGKLLETATREAEDVSEVTLRAAVRADVPLQRTSSLGMFKPRTEAPAEQKEPELGPRDTKEKKATGAR